MFRFRCTLLKRMIYLIFDHGRKGAVFLTEEQILTILESLRNGTEKQVTIQKDDFLTFRSILVKQDDFKYFRGIAKHRGDVIFEYLKEARS